MKKDSAAVLFAFCVALGIALLFGALVGDLITIGELAIIYLIFYWAILIRLHQDLSEERILRRLKNG